MSDPSFLAQRCVELVDKENELCKEIGELHEKVSSLEKRLDQCANLVEKKDREISKLTQELLTAKEREKKLIFALDYLYNEVKDWSGIPGEILGVAREALKGGDK